MRLLVCYVLVLAFIVLGCVYRYGSYWKGSYRGGSYRGEIDSTTLIRTLDALTKTLQYMHRSVLELNLDAVFCAKKTHEQLQSFLLHQPETFVDIRELLEDLRDTAKYIVDKGLPNVYKQNPSYAKLLGFMIKESKIPAWYPSQETSDDYTVEAVNCSVFVYDNEKKNYCYYHMAGGEGKECDVSPSCYEFNERYHQRDYDLTHQVLFWQEMTYHNCVDKVSEDRRQWLCSNVMRDAKLIAAAHFPDSHLDLFMEQVGLCGIWGFSDFNQPEWLERILELQHSSGCYKSRDFYKCFDEEPEEILKRVKRTEHKLDDGCYAHYTAVTLLALVVNMRFEAEKLHKQRIAHSMLGNSILLEK